ncbi:hypothetical protein M0813_23852 [Anaeramoeba flamelloides]|uniref:Uncharacterized protein n=1 Tax=Anaeramoeba flamelloides TaxID=1746091 RepID=A0ABQ8Y900_9EUKA|nr:hypothetical protein M0813_23852 [Anaeramoeba flamelloides]
MDIFKMKPCCVCKSPTGLLSLRVFCSRAYLKTKIVTALEPLCFVYVCVNCIPKLDQKANRIQLQSVRVHLAIITISAWCLSDPNFTIETKYQWKFLKNLGLLGFRLSVDTLKFLTEIERKEPNWANSQKIPRSLNSILDISVNSSKYCSIIDSREWFSNDDLQYYKWYQKNKSKLDNLFKSNKKKKITKSKKDKNNSKIEKNNNQNLNPNSQKAIPTNVSFNLNKSQNNFNYQNLKNTNYYNFRKRKPFSIQDNSFLKHNFKILSKSNISPPPLPQPPPQILDQDSFKINNSDQLILKSKEISLLTQDNYKDQEKEKEKKKENDKEKENEKEKQKKKEKENENEKEKDEKIHFLATIYENQRNYHQKFENYFTSVLKKSLPFALLTDPKKKKNIKQNNKNQNKQKKNPIVSYRDTTQYIKPFTNTKHFNHKQPRKRKPNNYVDNSLKTNENLNFQNQQRGNNNKLIDNIVKHNNTLDFFLRFSDNTNGNYEQVTQLINEWKLNTEYLGTQLQLIHNKYIQKMNEIQFNLQSNFFLLDEKIGNSNIDKKLKNENEGKRTQKNSKKKKNKNNLLEWKKKINDFDLEQYIQKFNENNLKI